MTRADIAAMLRKSQMRNLNRNVTGLLLRVDNKFLQYFEGPEAPVDELWADILSDPRHKDPECLFRGPVDERLFGHWSMAFNDLTGASVRLAPTTGLLERVLVDEPPADLRGLATDVFHRFWAECAVSLPR